MTVLSIGVHNSILLAFLIDFQVHLQNKETSVIALVLEIDM